MRVGKLSVGELWNNPDYVLIVDVIDREMDSPLFGSKHWRDVIDMALMETSKVFGDEVRNDLIDEFELEQWGFKKRRSEDSL